MLSIDGLFDLLHRERLPTRIQQPEHSDVFSRPTLQRLFTLMKLGEDELAPHALVAAHPAGAELLSRCVSYTPKHIYGFVAAHLATAGQALMI